MAKNKNPAEMSEQDLKMWKDLGLDDFSGGFDDFTFDSDFQEDKDSRSPTLKLASSIGGSLYKVGKAVIGGGAKHIANKVLYSLPETESIVDSTKGFMNDLHTLKEETKESARPFINTMARVGKKMLGQVGSNIPTNIEQKLQAKLDELAEATEEYKGLDEKEEKRLAREKLSAQILAEVFSAQNEERIEDKKTAAVKEVIDSKITTARFNKNIEVLDEIRNNSYFQTSFLRNTMTAYMQKDLELKYKQFYLAEDTLGTLVNMAKMQEERLDAIIHNSSLPDSQKIYLTELVKKQMKEKTVSGISNKLADVISTATKNIFNKTIKPFLASSTEALSMLGMASDFTGMMPGGGKDAIIGGGMELLGSHESNRIWNKVKGKVDSSEFENIDRSSKLLKRFVKRQLRDLYDGKDDTILHKLPGGEWLADLLRFNLPDLYNRRTVVETKDLNQYNEAGNLTNRTIETIEEIIPGYLAKMNANLETMATGRFAEERIWDTQKKDFVTMSEASDKINKAMFGDKASQNITALQSITKLKAMNSKADYLYHGALDRRFAEDHVLQKNVYLLACNLANSTEVREIDRRAVEALGIIAGMSDTGSFNDYVTSFAAEAFGYNIHDEAKVQTAAFLYNTFVYMDGSLNSTTIGEFNDLIDDLAAQYATGRAQAESYSKLGFGRVLNSFGARDVRGNLNIGGEASLRHINRHVNANNIAKANDDFEEIYIRKLDYDNRASEYATLDDPRTSQYLIRRDSLTFNQIRNIELENEQIKKRWEKDESVKSSKRSMGEMLKHPIQTISGVRNFYEDKLADVFADVFKKLSNSAANMSAFDIKGNTSAVDTVRSILNDPRGKMLFGVDTSDDNYTFSFKALKGINSGAIEEFRNRMLMNNPNLRFLRAIDNNAWREIKREVDTANERIAALPKDKDRADRVAAIKRESDERIDNIISGYVREYGKKLESSDEILNTALDRDTRRESGWYGEQLDSTVNRFREERHRRELAGGVDDGFVTETGISQNSPVDSVAMQQLNSMLRIENILRAWRHLPQIPGVPGFTNSTANLSYTSIARTVGGANAPPAASGEAITVNRRHEEVNETQVESSETPIEEPQQERTEGVIGESRIKTSGFLNTPINLVKKMMRFIPGVAKTRFATELSINNSASNREAKKLLRGLDRAERNQRQLQRGILGYRRPIDGSNNEGNYVVDMDELPLRMDMGDGTPAIPVLKNGNIIYINERLVALLIRRGLMTQFDPETKVIIGDNDDAHLFDIIPGIKWSGGNGDDIWRLRKNLGFNIDENGKAEYVVRTAGVIYVVDRDSEAHERDRTGRMGIIKRNWGQFKTNVNGKIQSIKRRFWHREATPEQLEQLERYKDELTPRDRNNLPIRHPETGLPLEPYWDPELGCNVCYVKGPDDTYHIEKLDDVLKLLEKLRNRPGSKYENIEDAWIDYQWMVEHNASIDDFNTGRDRYVKSKTNFLQRMFKTKKVKQAQAEYNGEFDDFKQDIQQAEELRNERRNYEELVRRFLAGRLTPEDEHNHEGELAILREEMNKNGRTPGEMSNPAGVRILRDAIFNNRAAKRQEIHDAHVITDSEANTAVGAAFASLETERRISTAARDLLRRLQDIDNNADLSIEEREDALQEIISEWNSNSDLANMDGPTRARILQKLNRTRSNLDSQINEINNDDTLSFSDRRARISELLSNSAGESDAGAYGALIAMMEQRFGSSFNGENFNVSHEVRSEVDTAILDSVDIGSRQLELLGIINDNVANILGLQMQTDHRGGVVRHRGRRDTHRIEPRFTSRDDSGNIIRESEVVNNPNEDRISTEEKNQIIEDFVRENSFGSEAYADVLRHACLSAPGWNNPSVTENEFINRYTTEPEYRQRLIAHAREQHILEESDNPDISGAQTLEQEERSEYEQRQREISDRAREAGEGFDADEILDSGLVGKERRAREFLREDWNRTKEHLSPITNAIGGFIRDDWNRTKEHIGPVANTIGEFFRNDVNRTREDWNRAREFVRNDVNRTREDWNRAREFVRNDVNRTGEDAQMVWDAIKSSPHAIGRYLRDDVNETGEDIQKVWDIIKRNARDMGRYIAYDWIETKKDIQEDWDRTKGDARRVGEFFVNDNGDIQEPLDSRSKHNPWGSGYYGEHNPDSLGRTDANNDNIRRELLDSRSQHDPWGSGYYGENTPDPFGHTDADHRRYIQDNVFNHLARGGVVIDANENLRKYGGVVTEPTNIAGGRIQVGEAGAESVIPHRDNQRFKELIINAVLDTMGKDKADAVANALSDYAPIEHMAQGGTIGKGKDSLSGSESILKSILKVLIESKNHTISMDTKLSDVFGGAVDATGKAITSGGQAMGNMASGITRAGGKAVSGLGGILSHIPIIGGLLGGAANLGGKAISGASGLMKLPWNLISGAGKLVSGVAGTAGGLLSGVTKLGAGLLGGGLKLGGKVLAGLSKTGFGIMGLALKPLAWLFGGLFGGIGEKLDKIIDLMSDTPRKGSYEDFKNKKDKDKKDKDKKDKEDKEDKSFLGKLLGGLGSLFGFGKDKDKDGDDESDDSALGTAADAAIVASAAGGVGGKLKSAGKKVLKPVAWLSRKAGLTALGKGVGKGLAWLSNKTGLTKLGKFAGNIGKAALTKTGKSVAGKLAFSLARKVVLGVTTLGIGTLLDIGGTFAAGLLNDRDSPKEMAWKKAIYKAYGCANNSDYDFAIKDLQRDTWDHLRANNGQMDPDWVQDRVTKFGHAIEFYSRDADDRKQRLDYLKAWYANRFIPVFAAWTEVVSSFSSQKEGERDPSGYPDVNLIPTEITSDAIETFDKSVAEVITSMDKAGIKLNEGTYATWKKKHDEEELIKRASMSEDERFEYDLQNRDLSNRNKNDFGWHDDWEETKTKFSEGVTLWREGKYAQSILKHLTGVGGTIKTGIKALFSGVVSFFTGIGTAYGAENENTSTWLEAKRKLYGFDDNKQLKYGKKDDIDKALDEFELDQRKIIDNERPPFDKREFDKYITRFLDVSKILKLKDYFETQYNLEVTQNLILRYFYTWYENVFAPVYFVYVSTLRALGGVDKGHTPYPDDIPENMRSEGLKTFMEYGRQYLTSVDGVGLSVDGFVMWVEKGENRLELKDMSKVDDKNRETLSSVYDENVKDAGAAWDRSKTKFSSGEWGSGAIYAVEAGVKWAGGTIKTSGSWLGSLTAMNRFWTWLPGAADRTIPDMVFDRRFGLYGIKGDPEDIRGRIMSLETAFREAEEGRSREQKLPVLEKLFRLSDELGITNGGLNLYLIDLKYRGKTDELKALGLDGFMNKRTEITMNQVITDRQRLRKTVELTKDEKSRIDFVLYWYNTLFAPICKHFIDVIREATGTGPNDSFDVTDIKIGDAYDPQEIQKICEDWWNQFYKSLDSLKNIHIDFSEAGLKEFIKGKEEYEAKKDTNEEMSAAAKAYADLMKSQKDSEIESAKKTVVETLGEHAEAFAGNKSLMSSLDALNNSTEDLKKFKEEKLTDTDRFILELGGSLENGTHLHGKELLFKVFCDVWGISDRNPNAYTNNADRIESLMNSMTMYLWRDKFPELKVSKEELIDQMRGRIYIFLLHVGCINENTTPFDAFETHWNKYYCTWFVQRVLTTFFYFASLYYKQTNAEIGSFIDITKLSTIDGIDADDIILYFSKKAREIIAPYVTYTPTKEGYAAYCKRNGILSTADKKLLREDEERERQKLADENKKFDDKWKEYKKKNAKTVAENITTASSSAVASVAGNANKANVNVEAGTPIISPTDAAKKLVSNTNTTPSAADDKTHTQGPSEQIKDNTLIPPSEHQQSPNGADEAGPEAIIPLTSPKKFANGGIVENTGGILTQPTTILDGAGVAGEAGPEAIIPLTRPNRARSLLDKTAKLIDAGTFSFKKFNNTITRFFKNPSGTIHGLANRLHVDKMSSEDILRSMLSMQLTNLAYAMRGSLDGRKSDSRDNWFDWENLLPEGMAGSNENKFMDWINTGKNFISEAGSKAWGAIKDTVGGIFTDADAGAGHVNTPIPKSEPTKKVSLSGTSKSQRELAKKIWDYFLGKGWTEEGVAGMLGNLHAESMISSYRKQNDLSADLAASIKYTKDRDADRNRFVNDSIGYGLAQWTYPTRKAELWDFTHANNKSISDENCQIEFLNKELEGGIIGKKNLATLKRSQSVEEACVFFMMKFENPKDKSAQKQRERIEYALQWYEQLKNSSDSSQSSESGTDASTDSSATQVAKDTIQSAGDSSINESIGVGEAGSINSNTDVGGGQQSTSVAGNVNNGASGDSKSLGSDNTNSAGGLNTAEGESGSTTSSVSAGDLDKLITKGGGHVNTSGLKPDFAKRIAAVAKEYLEQTGKKLVMTSAQRDDKYQAELWVRKNKFNDPGILAVNRPNKPQTISYKGKKFDVPGGGPKNPHELGTAVDFSQKSNNLSIVSRIAKKYGIYQPYPAKDKVHFQLAKDAKPMFDGTADESTKESIKTVENTAKETITQEKKAEAQTSIASSTDAAKQLVTENMPVTNTEVPTSGSSSEIQSVSSPAASFSTDTSVAGNVNNVDTNAEAQITEMRNSTDLLTQIRDILGAISKAESAAPAAPVEPSKPVATNGTNTDSISEAIRQGFSMILQDIKSGLNPASMMAMNPSPAQHGSSQRSISSPISFAKG